MHMVLSTQINIPKKHVISSLMDIATVDRMKLSSMVLVLVSVLYLWVPKMRRSMSNSKTHCTIMQILQLLVRQLPMVWAWSCLVVLMSVQLKK